MQELEKILEEMKRIKDGNRKEKLYAKYPPNSEDQKALNAYSQGYEDGTDNFYNAVTYIIRKHLSRENGPEITRYSRDNDGWIPVEERLPEEKRANYEVTFINECGYEEHGFAQWYDGEFHVPAVVIAWRNHLEPYRPERSDKHDK